MSNFTDKETLGFTYIDGRRVRVLKPGVKRKRFFDDIDPEALESHLNYELIHLQRWTEYYQKIVGADDFTDD